MEGEFDIVSLEISVEVDEMLVSENVEVDVEPCSFIGKLEETDVAMLSTSVEVEFSILLFVVLVRVDLFELYLVFFFFNDAERCESDLSSKKDNRS